MKTLWKCEHCASFYESKYRAIHCCEKLRDKYPTSELMITKYSGIMKKFT